MNDEKLRVAMEMYEKFGVDPDEIMMLTDDEFELGYGDRENKEVLDQIEELCKERSVLMARGMELEEEEIPEMEELVSSSTGYELSEYRSELSSLRSALRVNGDKLIKVNQQLRALFSQLKLTSDLDHDRDDEVALEVAPKVVSPYLTASDLSFDSEDLAALIEMRDILGQKIDYLLDVDIPNIENLIKEARDYYRRSELEGELRESHAQLGALRKKLDEIIAKIEQKNGIKL